MTARTRCVVTGATGFIGGALTRKLLAHGVEVLAISRAPRSGSPDDMPISWKKADVTRPETLQGLFVKSDYVIHAAGRLGEYGVPESDYMRLHVEGTRHVLSEIAEENPTAKILYVSSPGVLGPITGKPADESSPLRPSNPYERSKAAAEELVQDFSSAGLNVVIGRPEFVYGPGDTHVLGLFKAIQQGRFFYVGDGFNTCHPTFIADAADGLWRCLERGKPGETYHVTGPRPVTFRELAQTIAQALNVAPPRLNVPQSVAMIIASGLEAASRFTGRRPALSRTGVAFFSEDRRFDWNKARRDLAYNPIYNLEDGVSKTVDWYCKNGFL